MSLLQVTSKLQECDLTRSMGSRASDVFEISSISQLAWTTSDTSEIKYKFLNRKYDHILYIVGVCGQCRAPTVPGRGTPSGLRSVSRSVCLLVRSTVCAVPYVGIVSKERAMRYIVVKFKHNAWAMAMGSGFRTRTAVTGVR